MAVDFGAELQGLTRRVRTRRSRVHHGATVAETGHALAVEQVGIDAGDLGRGVGAQAQRTARELVHQFEGLEVERLTRAREQRAQVLDQWRHHEFVTISAGSVEQAPTQFLDVPGLGGQDIGDVIRQEPGRHGRGRLLKT